VSGHMAFPGGRAGPGDPSARAVAERETQEEVRSICGTPHDRALSDLPCVWEDGDLHGAVVVRLRSGRRRRF